MRTLIILSFLLSLSACSNSKVNTSKEELHTLIDNWHLAAAEANFDAYFGFIADSGIFIGTDVSERWSKTEFADFSKPYFDRGKAWVFNSKERTIRIDSNGKLAWFDEVLDTWMGDCRSTGVLENLNGRWNLQHYQLSMTIDNNLVGDVLKLRENAAAQN